MPVKSKQKWPLQRRVINKVILAVAVIQPAGTIPQIVKIYSTHNASSISMLSWGIFVVFDAMWLWYGLAERQKAVILSGALFTLLEGIVVVEALLYGGSW
ncbi:MAG TPA: hypothetical protein VGH44_00895 [Candidatus Saccharimonadia bacterium]|jgi:uncharacterized protein with PQ loop repeat